MKRRNFIFDIFSVGIVSAMSTKLRAVNLNFTPMVRSISTWKTTEANQKAGQMLDKGEHALDAAVAGVAIEEENPKNTTVGYGGAPDRTGKVTLDACVMNHLGDCGSVVAVENIVNVARLAKDVMEKTPHVMLSGKGAEEFAISQGYKKTDLLTDQSKKEWEEWLKDQDYRPIINIENHDTIGMLCIDKNNNLSGACTTSGLAYKMKGRVGDSPIIGSGLFIDNEIGGAVATGLGEEVVKTVGSFLVVELMRQGLSPQEACEKAIKRIVLNNSQKNKFQVAYIAMNKKGEVGSYSIEPGFTYMDYVNGENKEVFTKSEL
ncbi:MAG: N(4)-(beta-N-acetylglucosaminyl)-L-asparaginase [Bacteroidetes bacterium]|nr:N(4)-(beta-N-acetylglucosaminyl)-L-asparaginase [Bacteroidota bacterium]MDA0885060.1 N(4)-(beta-N-acetylglucosaminyl)-L-asparaginase [Bacteroidota bacterium]MDA1225497.1 N(4)-(beta-N-acetylglucosaminyl)-L-asparaginase [Bacteroidota bacterium]